MRTLKEIFEFLKGETVATPVRIPTPDDLALAYSSALMISGKYESPEAAISAAWHAVPHFYLDRLFYQSDIAPMFFKPREASEPELSRAEARAMQDAEPNYGVMADLHAGA